MDLQCLDHVHFAVPDLARAKRVYGAYLNGRFVDDYGGPEVNAYGAWHTSGGDFIQVIDPARPAFGGSTISAHGLLSMSFRVADVDAGIAQAKAHGLVVRSRIGSEDIGLGKNVVQAQLEPEPISGLPFELIEHQLPGEYVSLTDAAVEFVEYRLPSGVALDAATRALEPILGVGFEAEAVDPASGLRARLHGRLGLRLVAGPAAGSGLRAIAFRCPDLERGVALAAESGLAVAKRFDEADARAVELEPFARVVIRLIER